MGGARGGAAPADAPEPAQPGTTFFWVLAVVLGLVAAQKSDSIPASVRPRPGGVPPAPARGAGADGAPARPRPRPFPRWRRCRGRATRWRCWSSS